MRRGFRFFLQSYKEYLLVIFLLVLSLSILSLNESDEAKSIRTFAFGNFALFSSMIDGIQNLFTDSDELEDLRKRNAELMLQVNMLRQHGLENMDLKKLLEYKERIAFPLISANIVSKLITKVEGNYIINVGREDSVFAPMPVIDGNGLVGIIYETADDFSLIRTLHNTSLKIAVTDQRSNIDGILTWNGSELLMKNIPTTYDVEVGDRIVTSQFSTLLPPSIPIGVITDKETNISGLLNNLTVEPFVDLKSVKNVFVLKIVPDRQFGDLEILLN